MSLLPDQDRIRAGVVSRANPVAKLAAATVLGLALILTVDPVTASVALALELVVLPWCGVPAAVLAPRLVVVVLAAASTFAATALFGVDSGATVVALGFLEVTTGSLALAAAIAARIAALGLPGIVLLASTDPTDLGDALSQVLHLPHRFVLGALAALRLVDVLVGEWRQMALARRARGLGDDGWLGRLRTGGGQAFALLVLSVRRATVLATAMEARGFGGSHRTWARPSVLRPRDAVVVLGALVIALAATAAGVATGSWRLLLT